jgi:hypothetical protein
VNIIIEQIFIDHNIHIHIFQMQQNANIVENLHSIMFVNVNLLTHL